jgi:7-keto-8-aminopelargonate synthetase-like enzyme
MVNGLAGLGIRTGNSRTPIIPVIAKDTPSALKASQDLLERGIFAPAIRPPSVPEGSSRIRATVMATHSSADIDSAIGAFGMLKDKGYF